MGRRKRRAPQDWYHTSRMLRSVISERAGSNASVEVGRVRKLGEGVYRRAFYAWVEVDPDPQGLSASYICLIPHRDVPDTFTEETKREAHLLQALEALDLPFRVPRLIAEVVLEHGVALVENAEHGMPLNELFKLTSKTRSWEFVGQVAAAIHSIIDAAVLDIVGKHERQTAELALTVFDGLDEPVFREALAWAQEQVRTDLRPVLLHGDLLGQNILIGVMEPNDPPAVIDWSLAQTGDPAYDLAIVTRGYRRPFKQNDGLNLLLEAYIEAGGQPIRTEDVRIHELCMLAGWYKESLDSVTRGHPPEEELKRFSGLCRRTFD